MDHPAEGTAQEGTQGGIEAAETANPEAVTEIAGAAPEVEIAGAGAGAVAIIAVGAALVAGMYYEEYQQLKQACHQVAESVWRQTHSNFPWNPSPFKPGAFQ